MKQLWRNNGLSITLFILFALMLAGQSIAGWHEQNDELFQHRQPPESYLQYVQSGAFVEVTMENWESEFLQMFIYVVFTIFLYQRGSSESKSPDEPEEVDRDPARQPANRDAPWPVRRGGWVLLVYKHSLSIAFLLLFILSFGLHALGGLIQYNEEQRLHGEAALTLTQYLGGSRFWFESLQNWQSEFLAIWTMVILSIFLRQRGSPESKPVDAPHSATGSG